MKKAMAAVLIVIVLLSLAACGGKAEPAKAPIVGSWECEYGSLGKFIYTFNDDGTGQYDAAGRIKKFTYTEDGSKLSISFEGTKLPRELPYRIDGSKLFVTDSFGMEAEYNRK